MTNRNMPDWYPGVVPDFDQHPEPYGAPLPQTLARFDVLEPGSRIADIAGGYGRYAVPLAEAGHHVTIADIDEAHLAEARRRAGRLPPESGTITADQPTDVIKDDLTKLDGTEAVLCAGFLYLAPSQVIQNAVKRMARILRTGGLMVIEFATNRDRRDSSDESLLGAQEQNYSLAEGLRIVEELYDRFGNYRQETAKVRLREPYYLDADVIIASGLKT